LYEEGAFFKPHRDTEKVPGMFGTLVICLPSKHEGGEVHLSHAGERKVFHTAPESEFGLSSLAWYSDVTHEIKPITSGYRFVLTYNLVKLASSGGIQSAASLNDQRAKLQTLLCEYRNSISRQEKSIFILEHKYTSSNLSLQSLKGRDQAVGHLLDSVCLSAGFYFLLAQMTCETPADDYYGEGDDDSLSLGSVSAPSGLHLAKYFDADKDEILQPDPFDRSADSEDEGEYTGNEGMPSTNRYHDTVSFQFPGMDV
jgi:hypothetical protein